MTNKLVKSIYGSIALMMLIMAGVSFADSRDRRDCDLYNGRPELCNRIDGCFYDYRFDICDGRGGGNDGGSRSCSSYDFDPNLCNRQPNCTFDYRINRCRDNFGPGPGPGPRPNTITIDCSSHNYSFKACNAPGRILNVNLDRVLSGARCDFGRSWGYDRDYIWVDRGCRALFAVTYQGGRW